MSVFNGKTLLITGGTGSFGNAVLNRFLRTDIGEAAYPINAMGITKAIEEKIAVAKSRYSGNTKICCTRYGNVMCSRGSVIPLWRDQIRKGNPVTSTERPEALDKGDFIIAGIDEKSLLQAVDTAVELCRNGQHGIPVPDYVDENVSTKVVKIIQSYTGIVNKMVWRKF